MSNTYRSIRGMHDILPVDSPLWEFFEDTVRDVFAQYGYRNIRMPIVEMTALFVRGVGEHTDIVEKEMYSFEDKLNGEQLTLRPEGTAGCVRAVLEHNLLYDGPKRLWYSGPMFRHERPAKGRYRQFHQVGAEALGFAGPDIDAELMLMLSRLWKRLGLGNIALHINSIGDTEARVRHRADLVKHLEAHSDQLDEDAKRRLHTNPLRTLDTKNPAMQAIVEAAPKLLSYLSDEAMAHFEALQQLLRAAGQDFVIDQRLVRGFDYYNRTVFEFIPQQHGGGLTIAGGGRYDGLLEQFGGKPAPACGFGIGVERVLLLLQENQVNKSAASDAYLVFAGESAAVYAARLAEQLRDQGLAIIAHAGGGSFKSQMKKADGSGARFALIVGDDEVTSSTVTVKNLADGNQQRVDITSVAPLLR